MGPRTTALDEYALLCRAADAGDEPIGQATASGDSAFDLGEIGVDFVGRENGRATLRDWPSSSGRGLLIVTGPPGCGKSALISQVVQASRTYDLHRGPGVAVGRTGASPDASVPLSGIGQAELVHRLAEQLRVEQEIDTASTHTARRSLLTALSRRDGDTRIVMDGLDEADDPHLVAGLLTDIALTGVRLVVGTRPTVQDRPAAMELLEALGRGRPHLDLHELRRDPEAIARYVRHRLAEAAPVVDSAVEQSRCTRSYPDADHSVPVVRPSGRGGHGVLHLHLRRLPHRARRALSRRIARSALRRHERQGNHGIVRPLRPTVPVPGRRPAVPDQPGHLFLLRVRRPGGDRDGMAAAERRRQGLDGVPGLPVGAGLRLAAGPLRRQLAASPYRGGPAAAADHPAAHV